jgi:hypothetical protein
MMKRTAIFLGCALALVGCSSEEDRLEDAMRNTLASRGNVQEIEMTRENENHMAGFARIQATNGREGRLNCTADRDPAKGASYFNWRCVPAIDDALLREIEQSIRQDISQRGTVQEVRMQKRDEDNMTGHVLASDASGQVRLECTATRESGEAGNFNWRCDPPGATP